MAPIERTASFQRRDKQLFRVLVTGFGSFQSIATNPSHLLARELDGCFIETDDLAVVISCYLPPVLVDYEAVTSLVPRLHDLSWDLLLHIGIGVGNEMKLETTAHRSGYKIPSALGKTPPSGQAAAAPPCASPSVVVAAPELPEELKTSLVLADLLPQLQSDAKLPSVALSDDAGRYLCDFIFYTSLAEEATRHTGRAVQFLHLPALPKSVAAPISSVSDVQLGDKTSEPDAMDKLADALEETDPLGEVYPFEEVAQRAKELVWLMACQRRLPNSEPLSPNAAQL